MRFFFYISTLNFLTKQIIMKKLSTLLFSLLITGITCIHAQTDIKSNDELITIKVETDKSFGEHVQKEYVIVKTEKICDGKRKTKNIVKFGNHNFIQKSYSNSKNNGSPSS